MAIDFAVCAAQDMVDTLRYVSAMGDRGVSVSCNCGIIGWACILLGAIGVGVDALVVNFVVLG